ncbi:MAG: hypothetical protein KDI43_07475 [Gammaproteobacteria bacterium]|nr:hypothetical protein [Gammaproteobacteria bacterium]MCP5409931.1 hypothetical protein [Chromatiaceae bacterium]
MTKTDIPPGLLLLLLYSLSTHFGVLSGEMLPALFVIGVFIGSVAIRKRLWLMLPLIPPGIYLIWSSQAATSFLLLPPVLIYLALALFFSSTLLPGSQPLITQFARIMGSDLNPKVLRYTRQVTIAWVLFFLLMSAEVVLLALFASPFIWSLFTNFVNYIFLFLFFLAEYRMRTRQFTDLEHPGFMAFIRSLAKVDPKCIKTF